MSQEIFWTEDEVYERALNAFPYLANHIAGTDLGLADLYHASVIVENFFDGDLDGQGPAHLTRLNAPIKSTGGTF
jgi:hypothetical protein